MEQAHGVDEADTTRPRGRAVSNRVLRVLLGLTLLALYVSLLARNDIADFITSRFPALPGARWLVPGVLAVTALGLSTVLVGRRLAARGRGWRIWREEAVRSWVGEHAVALALCAITGGALALRLFGISDNLPYINYPDEPAVADRALKILQTGDYNPHYFVYPSLYYYMQAGVYIVRFFALVSSGKIVNLEGAQPVDFYLWGRILTAVLGTLTVPLVYFAGRRLYGGIYGNGYGKVVGLAGAAFVAASTVHIVYSQLITTDVPAAFFTALAFVMIARLLPKKGSSKRYEDGRQLGSNQGTYALVSYDRYLAAGIAMGLALSTKYNSALVLLPFLLAHLYAAWEMPGRRLQAFLGARLWVGLAGMSAAFLITTPFAIFDLPTFLDDVASVVTHYSAGHLGHEGEDNWLFYIRSFLSSDTIPTLLTLVGVGLAFARHRWADIIVLSFPVAFYLSMSNYRVNFTRNLLPMLPFTSVLAALPLALAWQWAMNRKQSEISLGGRGRIAVSSAATWGLAVVVALSVLPATGAALHRGYRQTQPDTRVKASVWLDLNTSPGTKLWADKSAPLLTPGRYIVEQGDHVIEHDMAWYVANRFDYLVVSSGAYGRVVYDQPESDPPTREAYIAFFKENEQRLAASFDSNTEDTTGPSVKIYRTGYSPPRTPSEVKAEHLVNAAFHELAANGGTVQLVGADYPSTIVAGEVLPLVLYWSADKKLGTDYTVFVHLVNAAGDVQAQRDTQPRNGTYPTSAWPAGGVTVDEAYLALPQGLAPGDYNMRVGLYLQRDGQAVGAFKVGNAPPGGGQDFVVLGPITVHK
jgi:4-amino-4-deoxy-L-arabinose transferase-like glycosyltransferase